MKRYEVLLDKELFHGSDIVRSFGYKAAVSGDNYALFQEIFFQTLQLYFPPKSHYNRSTDLQGGAVYDHPAH